MVDIENMVREIRKKERFEKLTKEDVSKYAVKLADLLNIQDDDRLKREIIISLKQIDNNLWEIQETEEYMSDKVLIKYIDDIISKKDYLSLTIPIEDLKELADNNIDAKEYFNCKEIFKKQDIPNENIIPLLKLPDNTRNKIIENINEKSFDKIVRNNYCSLYADVEKKNSISEEERNNFSKIININNSKIESTPYNDDFDKDNFHIDSYSDLKKIDSIKDNKLEELLDSKYSAYDIKREFCNRFMNIDPIILENCFYNPKNKEILSKIKNIDELKNIVNMSIVDKGDLIRLYSKYMYSGKTIKLPDNLLTYGYAHTSIKDVKEIKSSHIDYNENKYYYEIYFCRECLLDSNQKKLDRETQFEIPIGALRNNKHFVYENVVRNNTYEHNMAYPKIELRKEDIKPEWYIRDYLTIEAISSNVDIDNPKRFENEIPKSKNYSHLYDSYMYKEAYDKAQNELEDADSENKMNDMFGTVGITTEKAGKKENINEDEPIV